MYQHLRYSLAVSKWVDESYRSTCGVLRARISAAICRKHSALRATRCQWHLSAVQSHLSERCISVQCFNPLEPSFPGSFGSLLPPRVKRPSSSSHNETDSILLISNDPAFCVSIPAHSRDHGNLCTSSFSSSSLAPQPLNRLQRAPWAISRARRCSNVSTRSARDAAPVWHFLAILCTSCRGSKPTTKPSTLPRLPLSDPRRPTRLPKLSIAPCRARSMSKPSLEGILTGEP